MKKILITSVKTILLVNILLSTNSCNFGAKESETDNAAFDQEAFNTLVQGVYEYTAPLRGYAIMVNGHYIFVYGNSDTTMISHGGTYEIASDTVTIKILFATNTGLSGGSFQFTAEALEADSVLSTVFDAEGNASYTVKTKKLVDATNENTTSYKPYEGVFQYIDPLQGLAIGFEGYYIYLGGSTDTTMDFNSGTYTVENDILTNTNEYALDPMAIGTTMRWTPGQGEGDTLLYHILDDAGEVISTGRSLRLK